MKRLLVFSAYYEPETAASLYLSTNLYENFAANGWHVDLFVPVPTRGVSDEVRNSYKKQPIEKKINDNLVIHRILIPKEGKNTILRAFRYFLLNCAFIWKGLRVKADLIFVQSTPPTQGAMASLLRKVKRIPLISNLQDIFPDSLVSTGMTKEGSLVWKVGRVIERFTYKNADRIIVISDDMKNNLVGKGVDEKKIVKIYNWVDIDRTRKINRSQNILFDELHLDRDKFYITYAGNLGYSQGVDTIFKAADILKNEPVRFIIFGGGSQYQDFARKAKSMANLDLYPLLPAERVPEVYSLGNMSIVCCRKGVGKGALPSKTWNIMACSTPVLLSFDRNTELERIITENNAGLFSDAEDFAGLADNIKRVMNNSAQITCMGEHARSTAEKKFSSGVCLPQYLDVLNSFLNDEGL